MELNIYFQYRKEVLSLPDTDFLDSEPDRGELIQVDLAQQGLGQIDLKQMQHQYRNHRQQ